MQLKVQFQKVLQQLDTDQLQRCARFLNSSAGDNDDDGLDEEFEGAAAHGARLPSIVATNVRVRTGKCTSTCVSHASRCILSSN